jgi:serine/threonine-protein kinase RsbW
MTRAATAVTETRIFAGSPNEVRNVRSFVGQVIQGCPVADDIVLLASELAANAVVHTESGTDGTFSVRVCAEDGNTRVEVHDLGSGNAPTVHDSAITAEAGRGLCLVEMIATRWGHSGGQRGRVVWFEVEWK